MTAATRLARRAEALVPGAWEIAHPRPFLAELTVGPEAMSPVVAHVANTEYVHWLDRAAELHSDHAGYTRRNLLDSGSMWFVARHEIDYLAEAALGDLIVIATWVRDMQRASSWRDSVMVRENDATVVCRAATLWVLVDLATRRPRRIPSEMAERFDPLAPQPGRSTVDSAARFFFRDPEGERCTSP